MDKDTLIGLLTGVAGIQTESTVELGGYFYLLFTSETRFQAAYHNRRTYVSPFLEVDRTIFASDTKSSWEDFWKDQFMVTPEGLLLLKSEIGIEADKKTKSSKIWRVFSNTGRILRLAPELSDIKSCKLIKGSDEPNVRKPCFLVRQGDIGMVFTPNEHDGRPFQSPLITFNSEQAIYVEFWASQTNRSRIMITDSDGKIRMFNPLNGRTSDPV